MNREYGSQLSNRYILKPDLNKGENYLSLAFGKIRNAWENPVQSSSTLMTTIYFRILRDGSIVEAKVEKTSGIDLFDQSAMRAIVSSEPFPPLPNEFTGEYLGILRARGSC